MKSLNEEQRRQLIVQYQLDHPTASKYAIAEYFKQMNVSRSTVYHVLNSYEGRGTTSRAQGSGTIPVKMPPGRIKELVKDALSNKGLSQRELANKYDITLSYVNEILQREGVHAYKKTKVPYTTASQQESQKLRIDRLYRAILSEGDGNPDIVMDDESYFTLSHYNMPSNQYYYAPCSGDAPDSVKYATKKKFEMKIMVWLALSPKGISKPYFCQANVAVTKEIYSEKCIRQRLYPFINENHNDGYYLFWPDLASSHYSRLTMEIFDELGINVVPKTKNPPCVPQLRPIEHFWGILKAEVYKHNWRANDLDQLKNRIKYCLRNKIDKTVVHDMMLKVKSNLRKARQDGIQSSYH